MTPSDSKSTPITAETAHWAKWANAEPAWEWPTGRAAVTVTFDVDAEASYLSLGNEYRDRLSSLSDGRFSVIRAVPRILSLLRRLNIKTTFFIPGWTAENYPHVVDAILSDGHEIGHHGYLHSRTDQISAPAQREEMERGFAALEAVGAPRPRGYRSTAWEMTAETVGLYKEFGFLYDSSFFSDDRPYIEKIGDVEILELPSHWSLDDWPYFGYTLDHGGNTSQASTWRHNMWAEYVQAKSESRNVNFVCHPEIIGRGHRFAELERLLETIMDDGQSWIATMEEVALHCGPRLRSSFDSGAVPSRQGPT